MTRQGQKATHSIPGGSLSDGDYIVNVTCTDVNSNEDSIVSTENLTIWSWEPEVMLVSGPSISEIEYNYHPIAASGSYVHLVWEDNRTGQQDVFYKNSSDNGATWSQDYNLTSANSDSPTVAASGSYVHAAWDPRSYINSSDYGTTWSPIFQFTSFFDTSAIVADGSNVYLVFYNGSGIGLMNSSDYGTTWSSQIVSGDELKSTLAVSGSDIHVLWMNESKVHYLNSHDGGGTWNSVQTLNTYSQYSPEIAVSGQNVYLVWGNNSSDGFDSIYFKNSSDGGNSWSQDQLLSREQYIPLRHPAVAASGQNVHVVWKRYFNGWDVSYKKSLDGGSTWSRDYELSYTESSKLTSYPKIVVSGSYLHVIWQEYCNNSYPCEIWYKRYNPT
jgi:hypothetical protein